MNLLAKRENDLPMELDHPLPGVEEFFRSVFGPGTQDLLHHHPSPWGAVHDLKVGEKEVTLLFACPGHRAEDFDVEITGNLISVRTRCCCENEHANPGHNYTFKERSCMNFEESLHLPVRVEQSGAKASYENGVLKVEIPRELKKSAKSRTIKVGCCK